MNDLNIYNDEEGDEEFEDYYDEDRFFYEVDRELEENERNKEILQKQI